MDVRIDPTWKKELADQWDAPYFVRLTDWVRARYATTVVYPPPAKIFNAFDLCPFDKVRVVILGQDPYHGPGQANGLCFSVADGVPMPPSLVNIFKEVSQSTGTSMPLSGNLERWAKQGVLLLNSTLTVDAGRAASHAGQGWETFTDAVIDKLSKDRTGLVFMLWGSYAIRKGALIDGSKHLVLTSPHPSPLSAYRGFLGNGHFIKANQYLTAREEAPIEW